MTTLVRPAAIADAERRTLLSEDSALRVRTDQAAGEVVLAGMGESHLEMVIDRLAREFDVKPSLGRPRVRYKERSPVPRMAR